ncbi:acyltransferase family protein [Aestuariivirga litoralis]|uniref:acyltransferase family protein n=1 Tax=Aestuariivirga litoralis TaxID=2650924 RepID=UPI0018C6DBB7|nr:acyltransferase [Aestuariivirga litoralis]MBG1233843.1 acyltransferase [Aestuariivirga litoralis]
MTPSHQRIESLDGLRGLAILFVIGFHAFARWPDLVPYHDAYAGLPVFAYGWLGVNLFFLISGYVILMTLRKCDGLGTFIKRRWLRLFPAMLICSLIIFATASLLPDRPMGAPQALSLLPGLTFIAPALWQAVLHMPVPPLEGAFWSLYLEVIFYFTFGTAYFVLGERVALLGLAAVSVIAAAFTWAPPVLPFHLGSVGALLLRLHLDNFAWFVAGCIAFRFDQDRSRNNLLMLIASSLLCFTTFGQQVFDWRLYNFALVLIVLFFASREVDLVARFCQSRVLVFIGFISYPLYLLHENMMIGGLVQLAHRLPQVPPELLLPVALASVVFLAWIVTRWGEPELRKSLKARLERKATLTTANSSPA